MSWKECDAVSQRLEFVKLASVEGANISALCRGFGVSRKTGYKWLKRWRQEQDLSDQPRRPIRSPRRTSPDVEEAVVELRKQHPTWGGRKLRRRLIDLGVPGIPSASTVTAILHRYGLICSEESLKHRAFCRFERGFANDLWQMDFKGEFPLCGKTKCYPLTLLDDHTRYSLGIRACSNQRRVTVINHLREAFSRYGIPNSIYVDNGSPWGNSCKSSRHTRLSVWLMRHDIQVIHGRPYHPQGRGKLERFHRTLNQEVIQGRQFGSLVRTQSCFNRWRTIYNHQRPHQALNDRTPGSLYQVSHRRFQEQTEPYVYGSNFQTRRANRGGEIKFRGGTYRLSEIFIDQRVGLCPTLIDGVWDVFYCRFVVGQLNERTGQILRTSRLAEFRYAQSSQAAGKSTQKQ